MHGQDVRTRKDVEIVRGIFYDTQHMDILWQYDFSRATDHSHLHLHLFTVNSTNKIKLKFMR